MIVAGEKVTCPHAGCGKIVKRAGLKNHERMAHGDDPRAFVRGDRRGSSAAEAAPAASAPAAPPATEPKPAWWDRPILG